MRKPVLLLFVLPLAALCCASLSSAAVVAEWSADQGNLSDNINMDESFAGTGVSGTIHNYISTPSTAINQANYGDNDGDAGAGRNNTVAGSLNFISQLNDVDGTTAQGDAWRQFRLRQGNTLNPEAGARSGVEAYTHLFYSDAASQTLGGVAWEINFSNNSDLGTVRAAVRDTNGDWFLSSSSYSNDGSDLPSGGTFNIYSLDLGTETWAGYTPATAASDTLLLAPSSGFSALAPATQIDAVGFHLEDLTTGDNGRWRIQGFSVTSTAIPEPGSLGLLALGATGMVLRRRR